MPQPVLDGQSWDDLVAEELGTFRVNTGVFDQDYKDRRGRGTCDAFSRVPSDSCGLTAVLLLRAAEDRAAARVAEAGWSESVDSLKRTWSRERANLLEHLLQQCGNPDGCGPRPPRPSNASGWLTGALVLGTALGLGYAFGYNRG